MRARRADKYVHLYGVRFRRSAPRFRVDLNQWLFWIATTLALVALAGWGYAIYLLLQRR